MLTETEFHEQLEKIAQSIQSDIEGDNLDGLLQLDTGYECYVRELNGELYGYVYMGDCGEWVYAEEDGKVEMAPWDMLERVKALTPYREW